MMGVSEMKWTGMGHIKSGGGGSEMKWTGMGHIKCDGGERDEVDGDGTHQVWWV